MLFTVIDANEHVVDASGGLIWLSNLLDMSLDSS